MLLSNFVSKRIIILTFLFCLFANFYFWRTLNNYITDKSRLRFDYHVDQVQSSINSRLQEYEAVLLGARGLYSASEQVTRKEWNIYIQGLDITHRFPGILGLGYAERVSPERKSEYIQSVVAEGFPDFNIYPEGDRSVYYPIIYLEPFNDANQRAFGYDMYSEPVRREAMDRAIDSNSTTISGKVVLIQEADKGTSPGFLMYLPIYDKNTALDTLEQRRIHNKGFMYAPFRSYDLMRGILGNSDVTDVHFEIYASETMNADSLLYDTNSIHHFDTQAIRTSFTEIKSLDFGGKRWYIYYESAPNFSSEISLNQQYILPIAGILISVLITGLLYLFASSRARAISIAQKMFSRFRESEDRYKTVVDALQEGVILHDPKGKIITYNKRAKEILGVTEEELGKFTQGKNELSATLTPPAIYRPFSTVRRTLQSYQDLLEIKRNNTSIWVRVTSTPVLKRDHKTLSRVVTSIRDVTVQKQAEDALIQSNKQLQRSNNELQDFAYVASHDLQEPLRKISSFTNLLGKNYKEALPEQAQQYLEIIQNSSKRMSKLITDLLNYSRVSTKTLPFSTVDLNSCVNEAIQDLQYSIDISKARITYRDLCSIEGDELQLRLLIQNLISNAIKYAKTDVPPVIEITSKKTATKCTIYIKDNGIGFDEKYKEKIFTIFQRLHGKNEYEGTGVGLAICKKIVDRHNGTITAKSVPGDGSTFIVKLPLKH